MDWKSELIVLVACHSSAKYGLAGGELSILAIVGEWKRQYPDTEFIFVTPEEHGLLAAEIQALGCEQVSIPTVGWLSPDSKWSLRRKSQTLARNLDGLTLMVRFIQERHVDLVITNTIVNPWAAVAASLAQTPHAWLVREYGDIDHGLTFIDGKTRTLSAVGAMSDLVVANSHAVADYLQPYMAETKIMVSYPPVTIEPVRPEQIGDSSSAQGKSLSLVCVGRITRSKGQLNLILAAGELARRDVDIRVTLVGPAAPVEHVEELLSIATELGIREHVTIVPQTPDVRGFILTADVCVTPSSMEAFGRTTLEYMLLGKPVVATRSGGSPELVADGVNGWLVEPDDPVALANAVEVYVREPALIARHGRASLARAISLRQGEEALPNLIPALERVGRGPATVVGVPYFTPEQLHDMAVMMRFALRVTTEQKVGAFVLRPIRPVVRKFRAVLHRRAHND